jgi:hypothetical protein
LHRFHPSPAQCTSTHERIQRLPGVLNTGKLSQRTCTTKRGKIARNKHRQTKSNYIPSSSLFTCHMQNKTTRV